MNVESSKNLMLDGTYLANLLDQMRGPNMVKLRMQLHGIKKTAEKLNVPKSTILLKQVEILENKIELELENLIEQKIASYSNNLLMQPSLNESEYTLINSVAIEKSVESVTVLEKAFIKANLLEMETEHELDAKYDHEIESRLSKSGNQASDEYVVKNIRNIVFPPGFYIASLAKIFLSKRKYERVIEPQLADWHIEYFKALDQNANNIKHISIRTRNSWGIFKSIIIMAFINLIIVFVKPLNFKN